MLHYVKYSFVDHLILSQAHFHKAIVHLSPVYCQHNVYENYPILPDSPLTRFGMHCQPRATGPNQTPQESQNLYLESNTDKKKNTSPLLFRVGLGWHCAAHPSFLGNQPPTHPELQVVLSAHSPSQACSN